MKRTLSLFKALSDPTRMRVMNLFLGGDLTSINALKLLRIIKKPQSTLWRHLAALKKTGLLLDERDGLEVYYAPTETTRKIRRKLIDLLSFVTDDRSQLDEDRASLMRLMPKRTKNPGASQKDRHKNRKRGKD